MFYTWTKQGLQWNDNYLGRNWMDAELMDEFLDLNWADNELTWQLFGPNLNWYWTDG